MRIHTHVCALLPSPLRPTNLPSTHPSPFLCPTNLPSIHLSLPPSIHPTLHLSIHPSPTQPSSINPPLYPTFHPSTPLLILPIHPSFLPPISICPSPTHLPSTYPRLSFFPPPSVNGPKDCSSPLRATPASPRPSYTVKGPSQWAMEELTLTHSLLLHWISKAFPQTGRAGRTLSGPQTH